MLPHLGHSLLTEAFLLGCREFTICGVGEPTTHPHFYQFLSWAKKIGYSISFTSNGWNLDPTKVIMLDDRDIIRISVDTMHFRGSPDPECYVKKIKTLFAAYTKSEGKYKLIVVSHGAINSELQSIITDFGFDLLSYPLMEKVFSPLRKKNSYPFIRCMYPWYVISIQPDLKVNPCMFSEKMSVGQISEQVSLADIWHGVQMQNFRESMYSNNPPEICRSCNRWDRGVGEWLNVGLMNKNRLKCYLRL